ENNGYQGQAVDTVRKCLEYNMEVNYDLQSNALAAPAHLATHYATARGFTRHAMEIVVDARTEKDEQAWWNADETSVYATGASASGETTGLAALALPVRWFPRWRWRRWRRRWFRLRSTMPAHLSRCAYPAGAASLGG